MYAGHEPGKSRWRQRFEVRFLYRGAEMFLNPAHHGRGVDQKAEFHVPDLCRLREIGVGGGAH